MENLPWKRDLFGILLCEFAREHTTPDGRRRGENAATRVEAATVYDKHDVGKVLGLRRIRDVPFWLRRIPKEWLRRLVLNPSSSPSSTRR